MSTNGTRRPSTRTRTTAAFLSTSDCARLMNKSSQAIRNWVRVGVWPRPDIIVTSKSWCFRASVVYHYVEHGVWPEGTKFTEAGR